MKLRSLSPLAVALGVLAGDMAAAKDKAPTRQATKSSAKGAPRTPANQELADTVAERLMAGAHAEGADIGLGVDGGVVTVSGTVGSPAQKAAILQDVRVVPGVKLVRDGLTVGGAAGVMQAQAMAAQAGPFAHMPPTGVMPAAAGPGGPVVEPMPLAPGGAGPADGFAPPLPPYAWPTYAPHNNVSRVAYPQSYPYNAFPFIGPFYPFPKVPPGWRSVKLEWEDGHWWLGRTSVPYDYWRVRFW